MKGLVICSRNRWGSPTAEAVWRHFLGVQGRSREPHPSQATSYSGRCTADVIDVMETKQQQRLRSQFHHLLAHNPMTVLDIPDEYQYMAPNWWRFLLLRRRSLGMKTGDLAPVAPFNRSQNKVCR